ncbi:MAG: hypothetical protein H6811_04855 [Phycisphaeraceae bacterium]|nr:hypothetical protein [Phycisphaeraceae bacterium]
MRLDWLCVVDDYRVQHLWYYRTLPAYRATARRAAAVSFVLWPVVYGGVVFAIASLLFRAGWEAATFAAATAALYAVWGVWRGTRPDPRRAGVSRHEEHWFRTSMRWAEQQGSSLSLGRWTLHVADGRLAFTHEHTGDAVTLLMDRMTRIEEFGEHLMLLSDKEFKASIPKRAFEFDAQIEQFRAMFPNAQPGSALVP